MSYHNPPRITSFNELAVNISVGFIPLLTRLQIKGLGKMRVTVFNVVFARKMLNGYGNALGLSSLYNGRGVTNDLVGIIGESAPIGNKVMKIIYIYVG
jgi:hypothetical protein